MFSTLQKHPILTPLLQKKGRFHVDDTTGLALLLASLYKVKPQPIHLVASNIYNAQKLYDLLSQLVGEQHCLFFPVDELLRAKTLASNKEMLTQRLYVMSSLLKQEAKILITHLSATLRYVPSPSLFKQHMISLNQGATISRESLVNTLLLSGYQRVHKVDQSLQFAVRGDIVDIVSVNLPHPLRLEFFGDEIEEMRYFDLATQRSFDVIQTCDIQPATDVLFSSEELNKASSKLDQQLQADMRILKDEALQTTLMHTVDHVKEMLNNPEASHLVYAYYGFLQTSHYSILDYVPNALVVMANEVQLTSTAKFIEQESWTYFQELFEEGQQLSHLSMYQNIQKVVSRLPYVVYNDEFIQDHTYHLPLTPLTPPAIHRPTVNQRIEHYANLPGHTVFAVSTPHHLSMVEETLEAAHIPYKRQTTWPDQQSGVTTLHLHVESGFSLPSLDQHLVTSFDIFGVNSSSSRYFSRYKEATILKTHEELLPGDYVVHETSGIGQFQGVKTIEIDGIHKDYLHIQYAGTDVLYVPLAQFKMVRRFASREGAKPKLHRLNSKEWSQTKARIKAKVDELAERLVKLYQDRTLVQGHAFAADDDVQRMFEKEFPHALTEDQAQSLAEIKFDMEQPTPMDRLLCGDVGFGKTEVAFRAAFKALNDHKQVAILCPTTLLARQHYERAVDRFAAFGVNIAIFSRLIPEKKQKAYIEAIRQGNISLIIGTHRLLSKDIHFKDLGLLIVDEEQRFGVEQKERIKEMTTHVDVLTLSATPIPRTLQMSLLGIRQLSYINTSPLNRMPIQTYVMEHQPSVVKELIERELMRKGQVYYVHNRIDDIDRLAKQLSQSIKGARIGVIHGQMDKDDIETIMEAFYAHEIDVLVSTTIIENGIDVTNANLMIIENAAHFGLAQLYQIKGRVGRGNRLAYAYLLYHKDKQLNDEARQRLKAIQEFTELGSGYKIAQRDLLIRGAGDILGPEQAGFIDTVGLDMYLRLLQEAIDERKFGPKIEPKKLEHTSLSIDAYIPQSYASEADKVELYHALDQVLDQSSLHDFQAKLEDIFGRMPPSVSLLLEKRHLDMLLKSPAFDGYRDSPEFIELHLSQAFMHINGSGNMLFEKIKDYVLRVKVSLVQRVIRLRISKKDNWFQLLMIIVKAIRTIYDEQHATPTA